MKTQRNEWIFRAGVGVVILLVVLFVALLRPSGELPWTSGDYLLTPDIAHPVAPLVRVPGHKPAKGGGELFFVDVQERQASELEVLFPILRPAHSSLLPATVLIPPGSTSSQFQAAELREMATSQQIAAAVALKYLGYPVVNKPNGVFINVLDMGTPAYHVLQPADLIVAVNGQPTLTLKTLHDVMSTVKPYDKVALTIKRGAQTLTFRVGTVATKDEPDRALIGFVPGQSAEIKLPIKVSIDAGQIGGPSAGLAFTLELLRQLGHDPTNGYKVAATGTINLDGSVGPIGGIVQKTWGVREAGAQVFLVPAGSNAKAAEKNAGPDLKIIPVTSFKQALTALAALPKR